MSQFIGIDTSNYTTSIAVYDSDTNEISMQKKLLAVKNGEVGLRQSDAVYQHMMNLPDLAEQLNIDNHSVRCICASKYPRSVDGSYMPCFNVGYNGARLIAHALGVPLYEQSHQNGHVAAAIYSANQLHLFDERFIAFHVSGGTTEALLVTPDNDNIIKCEMIAHSLDLKAGQAIDRTGVMLGLSFPCGSELDSLSRQSDAKFKIKPTLKGENCCLSGVQNKCEDMFKNSCSKEDIALYCITYIKETLCAMTERLLLKYGEMPLLFAGGVMCNSLIKEEFQKKFGAYFAQPQYSCDNAAGTAYLGYLMNKADN